MADSHKQPLPVDPHLPQIVAAARDARRLVLVAEPGAGKTTRVPPALLQAGLLPKEHPNLVMLQPRRVAARAAAQRIAEENGCRVGEEVGYHVRFDRKIGRHTRLRVLTEGILTRQLLDDPFLEGIGAVILDEFHERSLHTDTVLALVNEIRQVRTDLIVIVMSATLDAGPVARYLDGCPVLSIPGRTFPVEVRYDPAPRDVIADRVANALDHLLETQPDDAGDVLIFQPGAQEIHWQIERLSPLAKRHDLLLLPLHGSLPPEQQYQALRPANRRKVIVATNIAETSLTIPGVRTVIDSGLARVAEYDPQRGLDRLDVRRISKASATQRAGRAGRTAPGRCIRMWYEKEFHAMPDFELPEIRRVDLAGTVLALHAWGRPDPRQFPWYEPPPESTLLAAERLLAMLGALSSGTNGQITELGRRMIALPVHPRLARLLIAAAERGVIGQGALMAAILSEKDFYDPRQRDGGRREPTTTGASDLLLRMDLMEQAERSRFAPHLRDGGTDPIAARQVANMRDELLRITDRNTGGRSIADERALLRLPLLAYPDRVCRRRGADAGSAVMVGGGGVRLAAESVVHNAEFFVALDARHDDRAAARQALVRIASTIEAEWLKELFPNAVRIERAAEYDAQRERVVGRVRELYHDLPLRDEPHAAVDPALAGRILAEALKPRAQNLFEAGEESANLLSRIALLREHMPEHPWPALDREELEEVLAEACAGKRSLEEANAALASHLQNRLPYPLDRLLEQHAPRAMEVPSGSRVRLQYTPGQPPVLPVRLQELFGWAQTPRIAGGRVPVRLHLLGPNFRPVQITDDLSSFWANTYPQVRKDLRARYPKHAWPDNPLTAEPQAKGGPRRH